MLSDDVPRLADDVLMPRNVIRRLENYIRKVGNFVRMEINANYCHQNFVRKQSGFVRSQSHDGERQFHGGEQSLHLGGRHSVVAGQSRCAMGRAGFFAGKPSGVAALTGLAGGGRLDGAQSLFAVFEPRERVAAEALVPRPCPADFSLSINTESLSGRIAGHWSLKHPQKASSHWWRIWVAPNLTTRFVTGSS